MAPPGTSPTALSQYWAHLSSTLHGGPAAHHMPSWGPRRIGSPWGVAAGGHTGDLSELPLLPRRLHPPRLGPEAGPQPGLSEQQTVTRRPQAGHYAHCPEPRAWNLTGAGPSQFTRPFWSVSITHSAWWKNTFLGDRDAQRSQAARPGSHSRERQARLAPRGSRLPGFYPRCCPKSRCVSSLVPSTRD